MPDHIHLIAAKAGILFHWGEWVKALKAIIRRASPLNEIPWRWQPGFHDHVFRSRFFEHRKSEYICLNPVRAGLVVRPEDWPYGGKVIYEPDGPKLVRGTPPFEAL